MDIILASQSPRRRDLLEQIGLPFKVIPSEGEEKKDFTLSPSELATKLAYDKALEVAQKIGGDSLVIGADTLVVLEKKILGKPQDIQEAKTMLSRLSGKKHHVLTGLAVIRTKDLLSILDCETTEVKMRAISDAEIERYIASKEPLDKAGAYGIQGRGAIFVEKINGCYSNVVGLPLQKLAKILLEFEVSII